MRTAGVGVIGYEGGSHLLPAGSFYLHLRVSCGLFAKREAAFELLHGVSIIAWV